MGEKAARPADPVKENYYFLGWYTDNETFSYEWDFKAVPEKNMILYAKWNIGCKDEQHTFTEWEETTPATCTEAAIDTEKCAVCGVLGTNTKAGHHALGHSAGEASGATEATCTENGYTGTGTCIRCSTPLYGEVIPKWGHDYHDWTAPTCTTPGNNERECINDCGTTDSRTDYAALGHEGTIQPFTATCTTPGNSEKSGECVRFAQCAHVVTGTVENALNHLFGDWTIRTPETCTATGLDERFCTRTHNGSICNEPGHEETQTRAALGHNWRYTVTSTSYPAPSTGANCTRCSAPAEPLTRSTQIGDTGPAGGIIIYVADGQDGRPNGIIIQASPNGTPENRIWAQYTAYYLEAAPANEGSLYWGAYGTLIDGVTTWADTAAKDAGLAASIGFGRRDTQIIVNYLATIDETGRAAQVCASKTVTVGGIVFNDWFLPSLGELNQMYIQRSHVGIGNTGGFFSSSQNDSERAWVRSFISDYQYFTNFKYTTSSVRAFRAF